ncbi:MAG: orotidine 5'-phosphate decarboxylase [Candidatus Altiarchaeota archaeon]
MDFTEKYVQARDEKKSRLCLGLDPALPDQRRTDVMREIYPGDSGDAILQYCIDMVESVSDYCSAVKANSQYVLFALSPSKLEALNQAIHDKGMISILDHKLGDIGASNDSAFYWAKKCGFDAITFSPYAGNIRDATDMAHHRDLGIIVLDLMSNPEAEGFQKKAKFNTTPFFVRVAEDAKHAGSDGVVVGATGHIREVDVKKIRGIVGEKCLILFPGIGNQGGDIKKAVENGGKNILINVGRGILYSTDPVKAAMKYQKIIEGH